MPLRPLGERAVVGDQTENGRECAVTSPLARAIRSVGRISRTTGPTARLPERVDHRRKVSRGWLSELLGIDEQLRERNHVAIERRKVTTRASEFGLFRMPHAADANKC